MAGNNSNQSAFQQSAGAMSSGLQGLQASMMPGAVPMSMNQYLNPHTEQVVNNSMRQLGQQQSNDLNMVRGQAAQAGAYGGARQGLVESELMRNYQQTAGDLSGQLYSSGFDTSAQLGQNRIGQVMNGAQGLLGGAQTAFGLGQGAIQMQAGAGQQQQNLIQQILSQASGQYDTLANYPQQSLSTAIAGVNGNPLGGATTTTGTQQYNPGMFDYLGMAAGLMGGGK